MSAIRPGARKPYARPSRGDVNSQWQHDKYPGVSQRRPAANGPAKQADPPSIGNRLEVSNLHYEVAPKDLKYDGSGRSLGIAIVTFETSAEATRAKKQFDGILAKGQPMHIKFFTPPAPKRTASAPSTLSLLARIEKPPLLERVARDDADAAVAAAASKKTTNGAGAAGKGRIGPVRSKPQPRATTRREKKKPKTAADLDKELDAFMGDAEPAPAAGASATNGEAAAAVPAQDVDMV
ncbi:hypothetical protein H1R20_g2911, partial [Candolleomyces eurysporus]